MNVKLLTTSLMFYKQYFGQSDYDLIDSEN